MKKLFIALSALLVSVSAFAYYDDYGYTTHKDELTGFEIFSILLSIAYIVFAIWLLVRFIKMTSDIRDIKEHLTLNADKPKITYLIAIGEKEKADKTALVMLVDKLHAIYLDEYNYDKANAMNKFIDSVMPRLNRMGINLPDHVKSGEKYIDFMNDLTGRKEQYKE